MRKNRTYHPRNQLIDGYACQSHPIYSVWASMMSRCYDPGQEEYANYGARGIKVDLEWHHFRNFVKDMGMRPGEDWTIERKDNSKGYGKTNCVWATRSDQCVNRRLLKSNTTGHVGVVKIADDQWDARFDYLGIRYRIGRYRSLAQAVAARRKFFILFRIDRQAVIETLTPKEQVLWHSSSTGVRGIARHTDGGYVARCTILGVRHYVGYFKTIEEAKDERSRYLKEHAR